MTPNAADRKSIRAAEKAARLAARAREDMLRSVMSTPPGRAWIWELLGACHCFHTTFNGDALQSAFSEGQRSVGLALLADITAACPDYYIQAMRESNERSAVTDARQSAAAPERSGSEEPDGGDTGAEPDHGDGTAEGPGDAGSSAWLEREFPALGR